MTYIYIVVCRGLVLYFAQFPFFDMFWAGSKQCNVLKPVKIPY